ncbi:MAG: GxxExxY protein, partial [Mariprofundaceae bacterium]|nr:GxxExxY protein [Mariprofundaceae bacterium]
LCHELSLREGAFKRQVPLPLEYKGIHLDCGYRMDVLVENILVVELKTGLLLNFHAPVLKHGIKRMVL